LGHSAMRVAIYWSAVTVRRIAVGVLKWIGGVIGKRSWPYGEEFGILVGL